MKCDICHDTGWYCRGNVWGTCLCKLYPRDREQGETECIKKAEEAIDLAWELNWENR